MYCPKCATLNVDSARFCRSCRANLSLVPQALSGDLPGELPDQTDDRIDREGKDHREPEIGRGIRKSFLGLAFLTIVAAALLTRGPGFGMIWLLIPAFIFLGKGIAEIVTVLSAANAANQISMPQPAARTNELAPEPE